MKLEVLEINDQQQHALQDKVVLVTGATGSLGRAVSLAAAKAGASVILLSKTPAKLEALYDEIEALGYAKPAIYPLSFEGATLKDYQDLADTLEQAFGRLDGIVHCAGILGVLSPTENIEPALWAKTMQVNLNGPYALLRACLPLIKASQGKILVTVDDKRTAYWGAYGISTAALSAAVEIIGHEIDAKGDALAINPPPFRSTLRAHAFAAENPQDLIRPEQLAPAFIHLLQHRPADLDGYRVVISVSG